MNRRLSIGAAARLVPMLILICDARGQTGADAAIDAIRRLESISELDQDQIRSWIQARMERFEAETTPAHISGGFSTLRDEFRRQIANSANTDAFRTQFAIQTGTVAVSYFHNAQAPPHVAWLLSRILVDFQRIETVDALLAGIRCSDQRSRYVCARGLTAMKQDIAADNDLRARVLGSLTAAALAEKSPATLGRLYEALAYTNHVGEVFPAYLQLLDRRIEFRKNQGGIADGAELHAYEFLLADRVVAGLTPAQQSDLVKRLAVLLRIDAERYGNPVIAPQTENTLYDSGYYERDVLERLLYLCEDVLHKLTRDGGGDIQGALAAGGSGKRDRVSQEVTKWIGDTRTGTRGKLNDAPWNVPVGAP